MNVDKSSTGNWGEEKAVEYIKKEGYKVLERNFRCILGEIDIVASDGDTIVFVEVKTRRSNRFGSPKAAVDRRKQRRLSMVALSYLKRKGLMNYPARFDVVGIMSMEGKEEIELVRNAFDLLWDVR